jgi:chromosome partitioning protein
MRGLQALQSVQDQYDYIIFDCPPNFNLVTQNGLFASDGYVIPAIPDYPDEAMDIQL